MADHDPFYVARDEILQGQNRVRKWLEDYKNAGPSTLMTEMTNEISQLEMDLQDLAATIGIVEKNPSKFQLSVDEINKRKQFISSNKENVSKLRQNAQAAQQQRKTQPTPLSARAASSEDYLVRAAGEQQQLYMRKQDDQLNELSKVTDRLGQTAHAINNELQDHHLLLKELDDDMDRETEKMNLVMKRVGILLQTSDWKLIWVILALMGLVVFQVLILIS